MGFAVTDPVRHAFYPAASATLLRHLGGGRVFMRDLL
jgi:hypothetical protein